jgi:transcriptional regulator
MYIPKYFEMNDDSDIFNFIENNSFGELITTRQGKLKASHLPFLLDVSEHALFGHFARANNHWQELESAEQMMVIFQGPHAYISPSWYDSEQMVPTWNYVAVQVKGTTSLLDENKTLDLLSRLTAKHEKQFDNPWRLDQLSDRKLASMLKVIVGFRIDIEQISAKAKLGQNQTEADREGAIEGLKSQKEERLSEQVAAWMQQSQS